MHGAETSILGFVFRVNADCFSTVEFLLFLDGLFEGVDFFRAHYCQRFVLLCPRELEDT